MPKRIKLHEESKDKLRPASSPEARENQLIALAVDEAEYQIRNHTASSGIIVHYLKLATEKEKLEREKLENDIQLEKAKTEAIKEGRDVQALYADAINAMKRYSGNQEDFYEEDYENKNLH